MKVGLLLSLLFLACILVAPLSSHGRQEEALDRLSKLKRSGKIDRSSYYDGEFLQVIDDQDRVVLPQEGLKERDRIGKLPGQPHVRFSQFGGYVTVEEKSGRAFYYYFVEAEHSKQSKPLLLWLNGGPGCSSLAYGAMQELGPFRVGSDGKTLFENPYAWNKVANVLFLESPAGVGFSYTNTTSELGNSGDRATAHDNYVFLLNWFERFPEYKNRDFYISGESYAGHYVPQLAHTILKHNQLANKTIINLKGITIGNAVINDETDERGQYDYWWTHALISDEDHDVINKYCDFDPTATTQNKQCETTIKDLEKLYEIMDVYSLYSPTCQSENITEEPRKASTIVDPCSDYYVIAYLNTPEVQRALHANVTGLNYTWQPCSDVITWQDSVTTVYPLLREFMANGIRVWVFSGDTDGRVPVTATRYSLDKFKLSVKTKFYPWFVEGEIGGFSEVYQKGDYKGELTFATVRGAGHQVPSYQGQRALVFIKYFLDGKPLPPN